MSTRSDSMVFNRAYRNTPKASLLHKLEGKVEPIEQICGNFTLIVDGIAFVQQSKICNNIRRVCYESIEQNPINWKCSPAYRCGIWRVSWNVNQKCKKTFIFLFFYFKRIFIQVYTLQKYLQWNHSVINVCPVK